MALERLDPRQHRGMYVVDHYGRYVYAAEFVRGRRVLDVACGPGYGSHLLATAGAASVLCLDVSPEAIDYARTNYAHPNVEYIIGDALRLQELCKGPFDVIVSFETIEHINDPWRFIEACRAVASDRATLICSVPNEAESPPENPYHLHHFDQASFEALLAPYWPKRRILPVRMTLATTIEEERPGGPGPVAEAHARVACVESGPERPDGYVAICGVSESPAAAENFVIHSTKAFREKEEDLAWLEEQRAAWMRSATDENNAWRVVAEERDRVLKDQEEVNQAHEQAILQLERKNRQLSEQYRLIHAELEQIRHRTASTQAFLAWKMRGLVRRMMPSDSRRGQMARRLLRRLRPRPTTAVKSNAAD